MGLKYGRITITSASKRFGSCNDKGNICLPGTGNFDFYDLFTRYSTKNEMITTFQALLELLKHQYLKFQQDETFGDITLYYNENGGEDIGELAEYN